MKNLTTMLACVAVLHFAGCDDGNGNDDEDTTTDTGVEDTTVADTVEDVVEDVPMDEETDGPMVCEDDATHHYIDVSGTITALPAGDVEGLYVAAISPLDALGSDSPTPLATGTTDAALADGFHSPLLRNPDPRKWAQTIRDRLGLDRSDSAEESRVPGAVDVGDFADGRIKLVGVRLEEDCPVIGTKLSDFSAKTGDRKILVGAIVRNEKLIIPSGDNMLQANDLVYFVSEGKDLKSALKIFGKRAEPFDRVLLVGGGNLGLKLAMTLEGMSIHTKLVEKKPERCRELAEILNKVVVLQGDGSDQDLLREENVQNMDVVITLTDDEETNILSSLLAKRMGAHKTITRINKFSYLPLVSVIGLEHVVSSRLAAINTILHRIRRGKVLSAMALKGEEAEVLEAVALETSDIAGKPLKKISFPRNALVVAIIRDEEVIIPTGNSIISPDDRIIILSTRQAIPQVEKALMVKLEYF